MSERRELPPTLFKYQPCSSQSIGNLAKNAVYFCAPNKFNDPYDCALEASLRKLTYPDTNRFRELIRQRDPDNPEIEALFGLPRGQLKQHAWEMMQKMAEEVRQELVSQMGVSCFSEKKDEILMWSHYAANGTGFCLEFDSSAPFLSNVKHIKYRKEFPKLDGIRLLEDQDSTSLVELVRIKSKHWKYEREWRAFNSRPGLIHYQQQDLKAIYFGSRMEEGARTALAIVVKRLHPEIHMYIGQHSKDRFKMEFVHSDITDGPQNSNPG